MSKENGNAERTGLEIAVVGMDGRFPAAKNLREFWENLKSGIESITFFNDGELQESGLSGEVYGNPNYVRAKGFVADKEFFDSFFFGYNPKEAALLDPQIRVFYECAWAALEDAACNPETYEGNIGVYAGGTSNLLWEGKILLAGTQADLFSVNHLCNIDYLSTRIAFKLDLKGPAITFYTACSTGLVAVDMACRELITGQCDTALAGAVTLSAANKKGYTYEDGMIRSPDGHCRPFDARARGTFFSEGVGVVVLKRLADAILDGNVMYAVILGTAVNNDGTRKNSFSAPCVYAQADVMRAAHQVAGTAPGSIGYVEAHGTATVLGDPIELESLKMAFNTDKKGFCALGSVKANIGHTDTAAGIAGFIKTVLILKHRLIPPSLHFEAPNPKLGLENSPFYVNTTLQEWEPGQYRRRAAVNSFGVGGTNAHAVLEEAPETGGNEFPPSSPPGKLQLILISAMTSKALDQASANLKAYFKKNPQVNLADVAFTLQVGRKAFPHRQMITVSTAEQAITGPEALENQENPVNSQRFTAHRDNHIIFMFPGQGSQYVNMAWDLYQTEPLFQEEMNRCFEILKPIMGYDLNEILYPSSDRSDKSDGSDITQTEIAQPVLFILEYALAKLLIKWGIKPDAMIGHSIGEYVAACLSGVFSLEDALKLVTLRGKLMQQMPPGSMLGVSLPPQEIKPLLEQNKELALAAVNAPALCVVSGPHYAIAALENQLKSSGLHCRRLHTSHAFHSSMMDPILDTFQAKVSEITLNNPQLPYISNLTGNWITVGDAMSPTYWAKHLRHTVRFADGLSQLLDQPGAIFIEVGPGRGLSTLINKHPSKTPAQKVLNLIRHPDENSQDDYYLLNKIGQLWLWGQRIDWNARYRQERRLRLPLPTYPFEAQKYPIDPDLPAGLKGIQWPGQAAVLSKNPDISQWFYTPSWRRTIPGPGEEPPGESPPKTLVLVHRDEQLSNRLLHGLNRENHDMIVVFPGNKFHREDTGLYTIDPRNPGDYHTLFKSLAAANQGPNRVLHAWNLGEVQEPQDLDTQGDDDFLYHGFYSLVYLAQAIGTHQPEQGIQITVLTSNMQEVSGEGVSCPHKATILGPVMIIPREYRNLRCRSIDILLPPPGSREETRLIRRIIAESTTGFTTTGPGCQVALRGKHRFVRDFDPVPLARATQSKTLCRVRPEGVYLITGGLGGIGLVLAHYLAQHFRARLVLTGRSAFPPREQWENWLENHSPSDTTSQKITKIRELENLGAQVLVGCADVSDFQEMGQIITGVEEKFGPINGVIHCAGLPGGGMIQLKTPGAANKVLTPKIKGTLVLDRLFRDRHPDFLVLCSSLSSIVPYLGQVDYCSANAFLDAFAHYKNIADETGTYTVSINWDAWQEVGMAAEAAKQRQGIPRPPLPHPLWEQYTLKNPGEEMVVTHLDLKRHWVLSDHTTVNQIAMLPGTAYLEMVRAAFDFLHRGEGNIEIRDVQFVTPLTMAANEEKELVLVLHRQEEHFEFSFFSRGAGAEETGKNQVYHARGKILNTAAVEPLKYRVDEIEAGCPNKKEIGPYGKEKIPGGRGMLLFGPRWHVIRRISYGTNQALASMQLDEALSGDLDSYKLHPALLDVATSFFCNYIDRRHPYIPFSYKRLIIKKDLPPRLLVYTRWLEEENRSGDLLKFNVTLLDEQGEELVNIEEFTMLKVTGEIIGRLGESMVDAQGTRLAGENKKPAAPVPDVPAKKPGALENAISPSEGIEAFTRILGSQLGQVLVSPTNLRARFEHAANSAAILAKDASTERNTPQPVRRPELSSPYVAPGTGTEVILAHTWEELLGIEKIGIHDNFFDLGGDSLSIVQLSGKLKKILKRDIPVTQLFRHLTIHSFAHYLEPGQKEENPAAEEDRSEEIEEGRERIKARMEQLETMED